MKDHEYRIVTGTAPDCQKILNQWKHDYILDIHSMCANENFTVILLNRIRKV